jgi:hypothetical protein
MMLDDGDAEDTHTLTLEYTRLCIPLETLLSL